MTFKYQDHYIKQQQKQKYMILLFLLVVIITASILGFGFFKDKIKNFFKITIPKKQTIAPPPEPEIDFNFLENQTIKELRSFIQITPFKGKIGRTEPFSPSDSTTPLSTPESGSNPESK